MREGFFELCAKGEEEPGDALCGLLHSFLGGSRVLQKQVKDIWNFVIGAVDPAEEELENDEKARFGRLGLLYKGELLLSCNDYKRACRLQKHFFGAKLPPYSLVQETLAMSLPSNCEYKLESSTDLKAMLSCYSDPDRILKNVPSENPADIKAERARSMFHHSVENADTMDPCSIQLNFLDSSFSMVMVTGRVLYNLLNLGMIKNFTNEAIVTITLFKDGTDKIDTMNIVSDRLLPVAGWKVSMAITRIEDAGTGKLIFIRENPCSQFSVQPLCAAFLDENDVGSLVAISRPYEEEAAVLRQSKMGVTSRSGIKKTFTFKVKSVPDKKVGTKDVGCTMAESKFICQKGPATKESAKSQPQACIPNKTVENASFWGFLWMWNPQKMEAKELYDLSTGMYNFPITSANPEDRPVDLLHQTKINFWEKIKKLVVNLQVFQSNPTIKRTWEMRGFSQEYRNEEHKLNSHLSSRLGITPKMTQNPGNDADKALNPANRKDLLYFLKSDSLERKNMEAVLKLMDEAREMFNFIPKLDKAGELIATPPDKEEYNSIIKQFHEKYFQAFPWASCSSGQHDIVDHIGEDIGSICEMSAQGVESQHHLWRYFLSNNAFKGDPQRRLDDSLENQYILTDDEVVAEMKILPTEQHFCSNCSEPGHNVITCVAPCGKCGSYLHKINMCETAVFTSDMLLHSTLV